MDIPMPGPLLQVKGLVKYFAASGWPRPRQVHAVDGVSFVLHHGETLGLVGESGCGKSTVGRCILRLLEPTRGQILFDGQDLIPLPGRELHKLRRRMQMVFQDPAGSLNPRFTVLQTLREPYKRFNLLPGSEIQGAISKLLADVGLQASGMEKYPHSFSGGQQQRIGVARAVASRPDLIVLDEPTSSLDVSIRMQVIDLLQHLQQRHNLSYLFISHDLSVIRHVCNRVAVMYLGRLVEVASAGELFRGPKHPYTQALIAAVPAPDPTLRHERVPLPGEIPSAITPPPGCRFHPRCRKSLDRCRAEPPELQDVGSGWMVACHLYKQQN
jgi:oligopeptide transport system ATP-binding protein